MTSKENSLNFGAALVHWEVIDSLYLAHAKDLRKRLTKLIELATPHTPDTAPTTEVRDVSEDFYCRDKKARMVPLPTFEGDLADWHSFWRRFQDYVGKLRHITDDERLIYLQDCLIDHTAQDIVADSIRNGDSFEEVEKRLQRKYDKPTPPLSHPHTQVIRRNEQDQQILAKRGKWLNSLMVNNLQRTSLKVF